MTLTQLWSLALVLLIGSLVSGYFAIFTNGGNGNSVLYLLFWLLCTILFSIGDLLSAKFFSIGKVHNILLITFLTFVGFVFSSPIGLMTVLGLAIIVGFFAYTLILLIMVKTKAVLN